MFEYAEWKVMISRGNYLLSKAEALEKEDIQNTTATSEEVEDSTTPISEEVEYSTIIHVNIAITNNNDLLIKASVNVNNVVIPDVSFR